MGGNRRGAEGDRFLVDRSNGEGERLHCHSPRNVHRYHLIRRLSTPDSGLSTADTETGTRYHSRVGIAYLLSYDDLSTSGSPSSAPEWEEC
jgi:hypothetical protein